MIKIWIELIAFRIIEGWAEAIRTFSFLAAIVSSIGTFGCIDIVSLIDVQTPARINYIDMIVFDLYSIACRLKLEEGFWKRAGTLVLSPDYLHGEVLP